MFALLFVVAVSAIGGMFFSLNNQVTADISTFLWPGQGVISGQFYEVGVVGEDDDIDIQAQSNRNDIFVRLTGDQFVRLDFSDLININPFTDYQFDIPIAYYIQEWPLVKSLSCTLKDDGTSITSGISLTLNANPLGLHENTGCTELLGSGDIEKAGLSLRIGDSGKTMLRLGVNELKINLGREITRTLYIYVKEDALPMFKGEAGTERPTSVELSSKDLGGTANLYLQSIAYDDMNGNRTSKTHLDLVKSQQRDTLQLAIWSAGRDMTLTDANPTCQVMRASTTLPLSNVSFKSVERTETASKTIITIDGILSLEPNNYDIMIACGINGDEYQEHFVLVVE